MFHSLNFSIPSSTFGVRAYFVRVPRQNLLLKKEKKHEKIYPIYKNKYINIDKLIIIKIIIIMIIILIINKNELDMKYIKIISKKTI